jgi:hypothetical protein
VALLRAHNQASAPWAIVRPALLRMSPNGF